jgi:hypothetical protein
VKGRGKEAGVECSWLRLGFGPADGLGGMVAMEHEALSRMSDFDR